MTKTLRDQKTGQFRGSVGVGKTRTPTVSTTPGQVKPATKTVKPKKAGIVTDLGELGQYIFITKFPLATKLWPGYKDDPRVIRLITQIGTFKGSQAVVEDQANSANEKSRKWAASQPNISDKAALKLASDEIEYIRVRVAKNFGVPEHIRTMAVLSLTKPLPRDPEPWVTENPKRNSRFKEIRENVADAGKYIFLFKVPYATKVWPNYRQDSNYRLLYAVKFKGTRSLVDAESSSPELDHRKWAASQPKISTKTATRLASDEHEHVRARISKNMKVPAHIRTMAALTVAQTDNFNKG